MSTPKRRNARDENERIKKGEVPGERCCGCKNHVNVDARNKLTRGCGVTDASVRDSRVLEEMLDEDNGGEGVWADSAYSSRETEKKLKEKGYGSHINRKGSENKTLGRWAKHANSICSVAGVRVEHVFGARSNDMGGRLLRSIGVVRAGACIGLKNLAYSMRRLVYLEEAVSGG
ncbi:MAG: transposase [Candidatus Dadabacteria bacterium]|nr:transposase [Candidatus Dadabacteria bacterium]MDE0519538.1 transposase [Candidatus Dadabacteria bacterium]MDE0662832.1 transposase [Candidatus Dadabacteria bacterium]